MEPVYSIIFHELLDLNYHCNYDYIVVETIPIKGLDGKGLWNPYVSPLTHIETQLLMELFALT